jgi:hypothetical protein
MVVFGIQEPKLNLPNNVYVNLLIKNLIKIRSVDLKTKSLVNRQTESSPSALSSCRERVKYNSVLPCYEF